MLVKKKDGAPRFCVDYRKLNAQTTDEASALPVINEALRDLSSAKVFSVLDLKSGYWQIPMDQRSKHLTAFTTPDGATYQFRRMPFGLKNAPATFQNLMTREVLPGCLRKYAVVYLDDVIIYSDNWEDHIQHLRRVLERLQTHNLRLAADKCKVGQTSIEYLGHRIVPGGITPLPTHLEGIKNANRPETRKQLRRFLGLCGWLRDFVPRYSETVQPLTDLLRGKNAYKWTPTAEAAFADIKAQLSQPLFLHRPNFDEPFVLQTDASAKGIAAVLYQGTTDKRIISFASKRVNPAQERYHANELECMAVIWGMKQFRPYLEDRHFTLRTDSKSLLWLKTMANQNAKLTRWSLLMQEFNFTTEHVAGSDNQLPDYLSRELVNQVTDDNNDDPDSDDLSPPTSKGIHTPQECSPSLVVIAEADLAHTVKEDQRQNPHVQNLIRTWNRIHTDGPNTEEEERIIRQFEVQEDLLWRKENNTRKLMVPTAMAEHVLYVYHDSPSAGHPGAEETARAIKSHYYWLTIDDDVRRHVRSCWACANYKRGPLQDKAPLRPHDPTMPWEVIAVDIMGPYQRTTTGNRFVFVVTDLFSRWVEAFPIQRTDTGCLTRLMDAEVFPRYGFPRAILSDNGPQFTSAEWDAALTRWGCLQWTTPIYHPRSNPTERRNQEIKKCLRLQLQSNNTNNWDEHLPKALLNVRSRQNAATKQTPAALLLGYELRKPGEWLLPDPVLEEDRAEGRRERIRRAHANENRYRARYQGNAPPQVTFNVGDMVMERDNTVPLAPFARRWNGPHRIVEVAGPNTYWIQRGRRMRLSKVYVDDLRPVPPPRPARVHQR